MSDQTPPYAPGPRPDGFIVVPESKRSAVPPIPQAPHFAPPEQQPRQQAQPHPYPAQYAQPQPYAQPYAQPSVAPAAYAQPGQIVPAPGTPVAYPANPAYPAPGAYPVHNGVQPMHPYYPVQPAAPTGQSNGIAVGGFVVGLISVFLPIILGLAAGVTGLVLSIIGMSRAKITGTGRGLAVAGLVLSIIGTILIL